MELETWKISICFVLDMPRCILVHHYELIFHPYSSFTLKVGLLLLYLPDIIVLTNSLVNGCKNLLGESGRWSSHPKTTYRQSTNIWWSSSLRMRKQTKSIMIPNINMTTNMHFNFWSVWIRKLHYHKTHCDRSLHMINFKIKCNLCSQNVCKDNVFNRHNSYYILNSFMF